MDWKLKFPLYFTTFHGVTGIDSLNSNFDSTLVGSAAGLDSHLNLRHLPPLHLSQGVLIFFADTHTFPSFFSLRVSYLTSRHTFLCVSCGLLLYNSKSYKSKAHEKSLNICSNNGPFYHTCYFTLQLEYVIRCLLRHNKKLVKFRF